MRILVTGAAGFIGSHAVDALLAQGHDVLALDNFRSGSRDRLAQHDGNTRFSLVEADLLDLPRVEEAVARVDEVWHIAANPDILAGTKQTDLDLQQNVVATVNLLEAMRRHNVKRIVFSSTSTVVGEADVLPTPEDYGPPLPISLYGASKLAAEGYISAFVGSFGMQAWVFRFANVIGPRGSHGVLVDFIRKLRENPDELEVLGDGKQEKSYLMVDELVAGMLHARERAQAPLNLLNLGSGDTVTVTRIAEIVKEEMRLPGARLRFTGGKRGWPGDVTRMLLATDAMARLGWRPKRSSEEAVREAVRALLAEKW